MTKRYNGIVIIEEPGLTVLKRVVADTYTELAKKTGIEYFERVHGRHSQHNDFVALVDEDGFSRGMTINRTGNKVVGYPGILVGPVVIISEGMTVEGLDFVPLSTAGERWLKEALGIAQHLELPKTDGEGVPLGNLLGQQGDAMGQLKQLLSNVSLADLKAHAAKELAIMEAEEFARRDQNPETD